MFQSITHTSMTIHQYQKKCFEEYRESIHFPDDACYLHGNPVNPVVPLETAVGKIMVIGPYPAAKLYYVDDIPDVPLSDGNAPFSTEAYFDGKQVRSSVAGQEMDEVILETLELSREECWMTSLVKVYLFDELAVKKYHRLRKEVPEQRSKYMEYANLGMKWIRQEIEIANPQVIILMGPEVIASMLLVTPEEAKGFMTGEIVEKKIIWKNSNFICLPNPGDLMDRSARNPWPRQFALKMGPKAKENIRAIKAQPRI
ncbi:MAG: uracil-DNA glycosylase family protein [Bacteroidales bacterium]